MEFYSGFGGGFFPLDSVLVSGCEIQSRSVLATSPRIQGSCFPDHLGRLGVFIFFLFQLESHNLHFADVPTPRDIVWPLLLWGMEHSSIVGLESWLLVLGDCG